MLIEMNLWARLKKTFQNYGNNMKNPKLSICIPIHNMENGDKFLWRSINALTEQSFQDFEIIITKAGKMAENTNTALKKARGELIKILYLDDCLGHKDALLDIVNAFDTLEGSWLITSANNNLHPYLTGDMLAGNNRLGSPSALTIRNGVTQLFDESMSWLLDVDLYYRLFKKYGVPIILDTDETKPGILIGEHPGQMTHILTDEEKNNEYYYINKKHHA